MDKHSELHNMLQEYLWREPEHNRICANCCARFNNSWSCPRCGSVHVCYYDQDVEEQAVNRK